jgi:hypothetical protein
VKIKFLKDCGAPAEQLLHPGEGCSCSTMETTWFYEGEELEEYQMQKVDLRGLKYRVDYDIIEYP